MRLFSPRKTTLMFVIRDKTRVRFSLLVFLHYWLTWENFCICYGFLGVFYIGLFPGIRIFPAWVEFLIVWLSFLFVDATGKFRTSS